MKPNEVREVKQETDKPQLMVCGISVQNPEEFPNSRSHEHVIREYASKAGLCSVCVVIVIKTTGQGVGIFGSSPFELSMFSATIGGYMCHTHK